MFWLSNIYADVIIFEIDFFVTCHMCVSNNLNNCVAKTSLYYILNCFYTTIINIIINKHITHSKQPMHNK